MALAVPIVKPEISECTPNPDLYDRRRRGTLSGRAWTFGAGSLGSLPVIASIICLAGGSSLAWLGLTIPGSIISVGNLVTSFVILPKRYREESTLFKCHWFANKHFTADSFASRWHEGLPNPKNLPYDQVKGIAALWHGCMDAKAWQETKRGDPAQSRRISKIDENIAIINHVLDHLKELLENPY